MITFRRPMLAAPLLPPHIEATDDNVFEAMKKLRYPVMATLKKDGIRALRLSGSLLSRTLKPIPNKSIRERSLALPGGIDMELFNKTLRYDEIESIVMSRQHSRSDEIQFHVLDWYMERTGYAIRITNALYHTIGWYDFGTRISDPVGCDNAEQLFAFEALCIKELGEGICFRTPNSPYKQGRSTLKEQWLVKLCRKCVAEAMIIGFVEQQENTNRSRHNAVGMVDRSSCQDGMVGKDTLGAFLVRDLDSMLEFSVGTGVGLTDQLRQKIWREQDKYLGKIISYSSKPHGMKVKPRSPVFKGFREDI